MRGIDEAGVELRLRAWGGDYNKRMQFFDAFNVGDVYERNRWSLDRQPLMQFTGTKDKNGKDIYEGDIVRCGERVGIGRLLRPVIGEIHYVGSCACFCIRIADGDDGGTVSWEFGHYADKEVIGTIYENPELLTFPTSS